MPRNLTKWNNRPSHATLAVSTGQQIRNSDPERYQAIVRAAKAGLGTRALAEVFGIAAETAKAIMEHEQVNPLTHQALYQKLMRGSHVATDQLIKRLEQDEIPPGSLPVAVGILTDKVIAVASQMQDTSAMQKIQITPNQLGQLIQQCQTKPEKQQVIDAVVVDNESPQS